MSRAVRWSLVFCVALLWASTLALAQCPGITTVLEPFDEEILTVGATAIPLTPSKYQQAQGTAAYAFIQVQAAPIVFRQLGVPTATVGIGVSNESPLAICGLPSIKTVRFIRQSATDALLHVIYYKPKTP